MAPSSLLLGAALQILVARFCSARSKGVLAFLTSLPAVFAVLLRLRSAEIGQSVNIRLFAWDGPLAMVLHVDALSVLFAFMGAFLGALVLLYSIGYMAHDAAATRFYCTMLLFIGGFIGLVYSANLFLVYLCWELIGLCSFSLVGFWYTHPEAVAGARKVLLMTHIAGYGLLAAVLVLYQRTGSALWTDPGVARSFTSGIFALMLVALVAKSVQVPLHTWIPEAMAAPTPVSALLHAACYVTSGVYLAARMHSFGVWPVSWGAALVWIGAITGAVGVLYAMVQTDLKRLLAFSTVSQIGYMMMGLGIGTPLAITAGLLHCLNHGFFKGGLFLNAGAVQHAAGTRDMNRLGGLAARMPHTTLAWMIGVASMMGIPLMSGFVSKWMLYAAALEAGWVAPAIVAWMVSLGTVFLCVKATSAVFLGPATEATRDAHEAPASMLWGMGLLAAGNIVLGIAPQLAVNYFLNPVLAALGLGVGLHMTWFGLFSDAGSFSTTGGLVLALVSLLLGGIIYAVAFAARPVASGAVLAGGGVPAEGSLSVSWQDGGIFTGGEPLDEHARLTAADFSHIFLDNWHEFFRWSNVDRMYLGLGRALQAAARAVAAPFAWLERRAAVMVVALSAALLAALRGLLPAATGSSASSIAAAPALLTLACALAALALGLVALAQPVWRRLLPLMLTAASATITGLAMPAPGPRLICLELGALVTIALLWQSTKTRSSRWAYLAVVAVSAASMAAGHRMLDLGQMDWARALLWTGFALKLAAIPFFFWLLRLADKTPALVLGLVIAVVDMAAYGELYGVAQAAPSLLAPQGLVLAAAGATSLLAALLMLAQRSLKRLLVLSTAEDVGFLLLGLAAAGTLGAEGALVAAASHALAKALLFACLSAPEAAGALNEDATGLINRYPVSAFGFLIGMLAMLGIPPTLGYIGRWRLYAAALSFGPSVLAVFIASSMLALIAYVLALTRAWWGPAPVEDRPGREPLLLRVTLVLMTVLLLAAGLWPRILVLVPGGKP